MVGIKKDWPRLFCSAYTLSNKNFNTMFRSDMTELKAFMEERLGKPVSEDEVKNKVRSHITSKSTRKNEKKGTREGTNKRSRIIAALDKNQDGEREASVAVDSGSVRTAADFVKEREADKSRTAARNEGITQKRS